jgi:Kinesin motor domain
MASTDSLSSKGVNAQTCNVQVAVRCRPPNAEEKKGNEATVVSCDLENKAVNISYGPAGRKSQKQYSFDKVFGMYSTQEEVFKQVVRPIVDEVLAGFNCTIFAYGQTGEREFHRVNCFRALHFLKEPRPPIPSNILPPPKIIRYGQDTYHGR